MAGRHALRKATHRAATKRKVTRRKAAHHHPISEATRKKIAAAEKGKHRTRGKHTGAHPKRKPKHG